MHNLFKMFFFFMFAFIKAETDLCLKKELIQMVANDQLLRISYLKEKEMYSLEKIKELTLIHALRMREIITSVGWPTALRVGREGEQAAWILIQHADHDICLQEEALFLLKKEFEGRGAPHLKEYIAFLTDRILINKGLKQLYGTQLEEKSGRYEVKPLENIEKVDEWRAQWGLSSLEEYLKFAQQALAAHSS